MKVYHGSYTCIEEIDLSKCQPGKDFGRGFYVTKLYAQAEYWAIRMGDKRKTAGIITEYEFNEYAYHDDSLKLLRFDAYSEEWFDFIILNRANFQLTQVHHFDIVEGPVADDAVTLRMLDYRSGILSKEAFLNELKFKQLTHQICFCTVRSLQMLVPLKENVDAKMMFIDRNIVEALVVDFRLPETQATELLFTSKIYSQLIDEHTGYYKKKWTEIYSLLLRELKLKK